MRDVFFNRNVKKSSPPVQAPLTSISAAISVTLSAPTLSAAGTIGSTSASQGSLSASLPVPFLVSLGQLAITGASNTVLAAPTLTTTGQLAIKGVVTVALPPPTLSATGAQSPISPGTLDFYRSTYGGDWTSGMNPPSLYISAPNDNTLLIGDWYRVRADDDSAFGSPVTGAWTQISSTDAANLGEGNGLTYAFGSSLSAGLTYFQAQFGRGADAGSISTTSAWFGSISDTLNPLATASIASYPNPVPTLTDDTTSTHHVNNVAFGDAASATWAIAVNPTSNQAGTLFNLTPSAGGATKTGAQKAAGTYADGQNWNVWGVSLNAGENANYNVNLAESGASLIRPVFFTLKGNPVPVSSTTVNAESGNPTTLPTLPVSAGQIGVWAVYCEDATGGQTNSGTGTLLAQGGNNNQALLYKVTDNTQQPKVSHFGSGNFRAIGMVFNG